MRQRRAERGVAVFVVVLVITLLTAIGVFAAKSASLLNLTVGHTRQATQTLALSDYGTRLGLAQLSGATGGLYVDQMQSAVDSCEVNKAVTDPSSSLGVERLPCYKIYASEIESAQGFQAVIPQTADASGSLGPALHGTAPTTDATKLNWGVRGDFVIELTEPFEGLPPAGFNVDDTNFRAVRVTLTTYAQISTTPSDASDLGWCGDANTSGAASLHVIRSHATLPMVPR
jgi:hypothetical protein